MKRSSYDTKGDLLQYLLAPKLRDKRYWDYEKRVKEYCREYRRRDSGAQ